MAKTSMKIKQSRPQKFSSRFAEGRTPTSASTASAASASVSWPTRARFPAFARRAGKRAERPGARLRAGRLPHVRRPLPWALGGPGGAAWPPKNRRPRSLAAQAACINPSGFDAFLQGTQGVPFEVFRQKRSCQRALLRSNMPYDPSRRQVVPFADRWADGRERNIAFGDIPHRAFDRCPGRYAGEDGANEEDA
mgnify:CR=1 FL=1